MGLLYFLTWASLVTMLFSSTAYSIILTRKYRNLKKLRPFIWVLILSTIETLFNFTFSQLLEKPDIFLSITNYTQKIYLILEIFVIINFFKKIEFNVTEKNILKANQFYLSYIIAFLACAFGIYFEKMTLTVTIAELIIVDFFFVKFIVLEIVNDHRIKFKYQKILSRGIFIFTNLIAPYSIINELIYQHNLPIYLSLNFINDIGYILLFTSLYKSSKCYQ